MATGTLPKPDQNEHNVGQRHSDDLFNDFEHEFAHPTGSSVGEDAAIDRAKAATRNSSSPQTALSSAENGTTPPKKPGTSLAADESGIKMPSSEQLYNKSRANRLKGGKRGIFIGLGAGGGIISVVAGFSFLLPFKLIGIMDSITDRAGQRLENMVEKRGEKLLVQYMIRGSTAAVGAGDFINTGNPIGDIFANIRTSNFEKQLTQNYGIKIERGKNGAVRLTHDGTSLGDFKNATDLEKYLNRDDLNVKELRKAFKLITKNEFGTWRFFKRAKFVKWLRLKYNISRFGAREQQPNESDADYEKNVVQTEVQDIGQAQVDNVISAADCLGSSGSNCPDANGDTGDIQGQNIDKAGGGAEIKNDATQALQGAVADVGAGGEEKATQTLLQRLVTAVLGKSAGAAVPFVGEIDFLARLLKTIQSGGKNSTIQKMHAAYMKRAYIVMFATMAGFTDQTKAGDLGLGATGVLADQYTGSEESQSWDFIENGTARGTGLNGIQKIGENEQNPAWLRTLATIGSYATFPVTLWTETISKAIDLFGGLSDAILSKIPGVDAAKNAIGKVLSNLLIDFFGIIGMVVNPTVVGAIRHLSTFTGATAAFDQNCHDMGCRTLTHDQAVQVDQLAAADQREELASESFTDRILNPENSNSLLATIAAKLPFNQSDPLGNLAFATAGAVASAPTNLANITTPSAFADSTVIAEDIGGGTASGGTLEDMSAPFSMNIHSTDQPCPSTTDGSIYNTCLIDQNVADSINCTFSSCADLQLTDNGGSGISNSAFDTFADYSHSTSLPPTQAQQSFMAKVDQAGGMLASMLPIGALEISRRRV